MHCSTCLETLRYCDTYEVIDETTICTDCYTEGEQWNPN